MIAKSMRPSANERAGNSAPINRRLREKVKLSPIPSPSSPTRREPEIRKIEKRSRRLTLCLICFMAALTCLLPFASLHLNQRVGLLLFESDLIQLRSSIFSMLICSTVLVTLHVVIMLLVSSNKKSWMTQRISKQLIALFASLSAISYLSIALIVPQVKQIQRMPLATFDCKANLITIENCHQQFTAKGGEQTIFEASRELLTGYLDENSDGRLIKKLDCLKYNDRELETLEVPTRFLLHNCGLVCKPQRQQLHQFGDDLNRDQNHWSQPDDPSDMSTVPVSTGATTGDSSQRQSQRLIPPYHHANIPSDGSEPTNSRHYIYHNASSPSDQFVKAPLDGSSQRGNQVSIKVCFSGEFTGGTDNYKQFCITNLANHGHVQEHTLTVGQLNAMLRRFISSSSPVSPLTDQDQEVEQQVPSNRLERQIDPLQDVNDQTTHYVNPVVQFESHFKNWPYLPMDRPEGDVSGEDSWCKFRPIPPFIVNNKPFSDIQCALEQEYTMTTGPSLSSIDSLSSNAEKIYLKKSSLEDFNNGENYPRERCNIQCKVNILYQVHINNNAQSRASQVKEGEELKSSTNANKLHYYLPLKPCIVVSGDGDKAKTLNYYLIFKTLGDSTLLLTFILLDLFLLLESIDTKQFQLEARKLRLISLITIIALIPLLIAFVFDTLSLYYPSGLNKGRREGYLTAFLYDRVLPTLVDLFSSGSGKGRVVGGSSTSTSDGSYVSGAGRYNTSSTHQRFETLQERRLLNMLTDNYIMPFFVYSVFMFILAIYSLTIPLISSSAPLQRVSSTEELGMMPSKSDKSQSSKQVNKNRQAQPLDDEGQFVKKRHDTDRRKLRRKLCIQMISIYLLALFLGTQFNLSQFTQMQIFIETFGNPTTVISSNQSYSTFWFVFSTQSGVIIFTLLLTLVFMDEISSFFANFSPFKTTLSASSDSDMAKRNKAKFFNYLTLSLVIYSIRYLAISNMTAASRFKWVVLFLFQLAELFNFPITWFALTSRAHELATSYRAKRGGNQSSGSGGGGDTAPRVIPASNSRALDSHIAIQSSMAFTYFAIGRSLALFAHSLHASLHLHSDNVDWFITSFYRPSMTDMKHSSTTVNNGGGVVGSVSNTSNATTNSNSSAGTSGAPMNGKPESLFSPLPGERQTYLHASRLFLRYNSLLCLVLGLIFLLALLYVKYQIWAEQRRTFDLSKSVRTNEDETESVDDQLSRDLMRIQANNTRNIYPDAHRKGDTKGSASPDRPQSPRAKILFHYNLGRNESSGSSQQSASDWQNEPQPPPPPPPEQYQTGAIEDSRGQNKVARRLDDEELRIPIAVEEEEEFDNQAPATTSNTTTTEERIVQHRNRRVRIFEDSESWPEVEEPRTGQSTVPGRTVKTSRKAKGNTVVETSERSRKRSISFAPLTTLIGDDGTSEQQREQVREVVVKRASPDPSVDFESDSQDND